MCIYMYILIALNIFVNSHVKKKIKKRVPRMPAYILKLCHLKTI